jgi:hypothetical protein
MKRFSGRLGAALAIFALAGSALPGGAQESGKDLIPFKITVSGKADVFVIPMDPPVTSSRMSLKGTSDVLAGEVTLTDTHNLYFGVDGAPLKSINGMGVFSSPANDALFVFWDGVGRPTATPGTVQGLGAFTIRGGRGKFAGATGSGTFESVVNVANGDVSQVWSGLISLPKK